MKKYDFIIGIDPDVDKSGFALLNVSEKQITDIRSIEFPRLIEEIKGNNNGFKLIGKTLLVVVEAGWLNSGNWHVNAKDSRQRAAMKGNAVGRNQETGRKIIECLKYYGIEVEEIKPLAKCWHGPDGKITHDELEYFTQGIPHKTNQEARDAALIAWNFANLPIRVKPISAKAK